MIETVPLPVCAEVSAIVIKEPAPSKVGHASSRITAHSDTSSSTLGKRKAMDSLPTGPEKGKKRVDLSLLGIHVAGCTSAHFLGKGMYGRVYMATYKTNAGKQNRIAIKDMHEYTDGIAATTIRELAVMWRHQLSRQGVLMPLYGCGPSLKGTFMAMPLAGQRAHEWMFTTPFAQRVKHLPHIIMCVTRGLDFLHRQGIIHRDIKTDNILKWGHGWTLIDFGTCTFNISGDISAVPHRSRGMICKPIQPPEFSERSPRYTVASDMWALGTVLAAILMKGYTPNARFLIDDLAKLSAALKKVDTDESRLVWVVIKALLQYNPKHRYTTSQILALPGLPYVPYFEVSPVWPPHTPSNPNVKVPESTPSLDASIAQPVLPETFADAASAKHTAAGDVSSVLSNCDSDFVVAIEDIRVVIESILPDILCVYVMHAVKRMRRRWAFASQKEQPVVVWGMVSLALKLYSPAPYQHKWLDMLHEERILDAVVRSEKTIFHKFFGYVE